MKNVFTRLVYFLQVYEVGDILMMKDLLNANFTKDILKAYLFQLCETKYLSRLNEDYYKILKKIEPGLNMNDIINN